MNKRIKMQKKGFTLLEILLTITLIGILASIVLVVINPNRQLSQSRDLNRQKDIAEIQQAVELYAVRNSGEYPAGIPTGSYKDICPEGEVTEECVDLSILVPNYLSSIPTDPSGSNYKIGINTTNNTVSVWSDNAEQREIGVNLFPILLTGAKDSSFDTGLPVGFTDRPTTPGVSNPVNTLALQSDGKILIGGDFSNYQGTTANRIIRLNSDGSIDGSFNIGNGFNAAGFVSASGVSGQVNTLTVQSDGKIIVGGFFTSYNGTAANHIIRLNSDGSIDGSFNIGTGFNNVVQTLDIQSDGKIIVGGIFTIYNEVSANRIVRLNSNGGIDSSFNIGTGFNTIPSTLALQSDGKIILGGLFTGYNGVSASRIIRLNSDGSVDSSFNIGTGFSNNVRTLALQSDGKIIVGGIFTSYNGVSANRIIRLNSDGSIDSSFNIGVGFNTTVDTLTLQSDGKIIVGGSFTNYQNQPAGHLIRLWN